MSIRIAPFAVAASTVLALALSLAPLRGDETVAADTQQETIQARVVSMRAGPGPNVGNLTVWIDRYTTDDELGRDLKTFQEGGQQALIASWQKEGPVVGRARFATTLGYDLRVARWRATEKGRHLTLVTDRPISGFEVMRGARSEDYPIAWIELDLDAEGKGEGMMIPAVALELKEGVLEVKSRGNEPLRLLNVSLSTK